MFTYKTHSPTNIMLAIIMSTYHFYINCGGSQETHKLSDNSCRIESDTKDPKSSPSATDVPYAPISC